MIRTQRPCFTARSPEERERVSKCLLVLLIALVVLIGCTQTSALRREEKIEARAETVRVLLMPVEIELAELTAGGLVEPRADWTAAAREHLTKVLQEELSRRNAMLVPYEPPEDPEKLYRCDQIAKLHNAVGGAILRHKYDPKFKLPTKQGKFDWTIGPGVSVLREGYEADYALFVSIRDTYSSIGRTLLSLVFTGLFLFPFHPGSIQQGFASLVDLHDGDIEWFNRLVSYTGDLRSAEPARETIKNLLVDLPL